MILSSLNLREPQKEALKRVSLQHKHSRIVMKDRLDPRTQWGKILRENKVQERWEILYHTHHHSPKGNIGEFSKMLKMKEKRKYSGNGRRPGCHGANRRREHLLGYLDLYKININLIMQHK